MQRACLTLKKLVCKLFAYLSHNKYYAMDRGRTIAVISYSELVNDDH